MIDMTSGDVREILRWCIENSIVADLTYKDEGSERTVEPHEIVGRDRDSVLCWQTAGVSGTGWRRFRIHSINAVSPHGKQFTQRDGWKPVHI